MPRDFATAAANVEEFPRPIRAVNLDDFLQLILPPKEQILAPWLPTKGLCMVFAPRGVGKTHFGLGVAYAVASGGPYLCWQAKKPRKVLLLDGEMPAVNLQERLASIVQNAPMSPPDSDYIRLLASDLCEFGLPDLATEEGQREIEPHLGDADLIVVDNLSTLARSGKENEADSWGLMQSWALRLRRDGRSVLFVHHAGKGGEQRGTSKREDVMDTIDYSIRLDPDFVMFNVLTPFPGTTLYDEGMRDGVLDVTPWTNFMLAPREDFKAQVWDEYFTRAELREMLEVAYRRFYWRPKFIVRNITQIQSPKDFMRKATAGLRMLAS